MAMMKRMKLTHHFDNHHDPVSLSLTHSFFVWFVDCLAFVRVCVLVFCFFSFCFFATPFCFMFFFSLVFAFMLFCFSVCWLNNVVFFFCLSLLIFFFFLFVLSQWLEDVFPPQFSVFNSVPPVRPARQQRITEVSYTLFSIKTKT